jgi:hypothetical protein
MILCRTTKKGHISHQERVYKNNIVNNYETQAHLGTRAERLGTRDDFSQFISVIAI